MAAKLYKITLIIVLIVFLLAVAIAKKFDLIKKIIPASIIGVFPTETADLRLTIGPIMGVYSTTWSARSKRISDLIRLADETEINAIVIDVKDSGVYLDDYTKNLVAKLHEKNIYAIARLVVFQDNSQIKTHS